MSSVSSDRKRSRFPVLTRSSLAVLAAMLGCGSTDALNPDGGTSGGGSPDSASSSSPDSSSLPTDGSSSAESGPVGGGDAGAETGKEGGTDAALGSDAAQASDGATKGDPFNYAPPSRVVAPVAVLSTSGSVTNPTSVLGGGTTTLTGAGAQIVFDFGKEVGGILSLAFASASDANQTLGAAFTESSLYVGQNSDNSGGGGAPDGAIAVAVAGSGPSSWTSAPQFLRGGFRYLTLFLTSSGSVSLSGVSIAFTPDPERTIPNQYPNYFYSNDDVLNKAWYAGAYTTQLNIIAHDQFRAPPPPASSWNNAATVNGAGNTFLVDGAKRDRNVWPGDMGVSLATAYVSLSDTSAAKDSLVSMYDNQQSSGELNWSGPPWNITSASDTYHMWTLHGTYLAYLYTGDKAWLDSVWARYQLGMTYITNEIDAASGLLNVAGTADWGPRDDMGGKNIEANSILYAVLMGGVTLATVEGDAAAATSYGTLASTLKTAVNATLWDTSVGAFVDQPGSTLHPQDGNALAVWFGVIDDPSRAKGLSYVHAENWSAFGSVTPEFHTSGLGTGWGAISTFVGSMELMSHFVAGYDTRGLDMIRLMWGYMLASTNGTQSTFWESIDTAGGFSANGSGPAPSDSFTSLAHGWATGPTAALTNFVLGVAPDTVQGATYHVIPHPGDLTHVEGKLTLAPGKAIQVTYDVGATCSSFTMTVDASSNAGSTGTLAVPTFGANHSVTIGGSVAWNGTAFVATGGVAGASQDSAYIYFTGVQPGVYVLAYTDGTSCGPVPEQWSYCADEDGNCAITGTARVRFGRNGLYDYGVFDPDAGGVPCTTATFGGNDPIPGTLKACSFSSELYTSCAAEAGTCTFTGTRQVRFGANGQWRTITATGSTPCTAAAFGNVDPIPNVVKSCEYR